MYSFEVYSKKNITLSKKIVTCYAVLIDSQLPTFRNHFYTFKFPAAQDFLTLEDGTYSTSQNFGNYLPIIAV